MLDIDLAVSIKRLSVAFVPLMLGIILHEVAHGWAALKRGDPTAAMLGRLTLNPVPHIDPMGLFVFVLTSLTGPFVFGWAKPVPINPRNFRNIVKDTMLVSFAGPATNFLLSIGFAVLLRLLIEFFPLGEWQGNTDNVPALLTEDEHVVNAEAAAMIGHDKLEELNKQGLAMRAKGYTPGRIRAAGIKGAK